MHESHEAFKEPSDETRIWRYMDMTKFIAMMEDKALYFTRSDRFEDHFEGSLPQLSSFVKNKYNRLKRSNSPEQAQKFFDDERVKNTRKTIGVNCWHINEYESVAMWKLYLKSNEGIAVQSTFSRLKDSFLGTDERVFIGKVSYIDYSIGEIPPMDTFSPFLHKRKSFEHEKELRAIIWDSTTVNSDKIMPFDENRLSVQADLDKLIEKVYLAPSTPKWIENLVCNIMKRYDVNEAVVRSHLDEEPLF